MLKYAFHLVVLQDAPTHVAEAKRGGTLGKSRAHVAECIADCPTSASATVCACIYMHKQRTTGKLFAKTRQLQLLLDWPGFSPVFRSRVQVHL